MSKRILHGIDVSEWQKKIDWQKVAADGVEFAMIRATHGLKVDAYFEDNIKGAFAAGINVGVYCCSYGDTVSEVLAEADFLLDTIEPYRKYITYPVAFDAEQQSQFKLGKKKVTELILAFCKAVHERGYVSLNYTNCNWLNNVIDKDAVAGAGIDTWVSWPVAADSFNENLVDGVTKHDHTMWQFTDCGRVGGINGDVDLNLCYEDYPAMYAKSSSVISVSDLVAELTLRGITHIVLE